MSSTQEKLEDNPFYAGMGTLFIPNKLAQAIAEREELRENARHKYGYAKENLLIEADNVFCRALAEYQTALIDTAKREGAIWELRMLLESDKRYGYTEEEILVVIDNRIAQLEQSEEIQR